MFDLSSVIPVQNESSSKGNQLKFYHQGYWIKLDNDRCYEGLAEEFVSKFEDLIIVILARLSTVPLVLQLFKKPNQFYRSRITQKKLYENKG